MPHKLSTTVYYRKLLADIREEMTRGVKKIEELLEQQRVISYWAIGRKINTYLNTRPQPRGAIGIFYQDLSKDLNINDRTLQQCEQFFRYFPKLVIHKNLKWSHYRFLLAETDASQRRAWIARIKKENIPANDLRLALMPPPAFEVTAKGKLKTPVRGKLYTYRLLRADDIDNFDVPWFVDLGFAARKEAPASEAILHNKNLYTSQKIKDGYRLKVTDAKAEELFTFTGKLRRVIDGDTLLVAVDQGFSYWNEQRLRLIGIDAPELDTLAGQRAKKWVEDELRPSKYLVVKTYKSDNWDRYLVDVFYAPQLPQTRVAAGTPRLPGGGAGVTSKIWDMPRVAAEGVWLNGRMVEAGIAKVWNEKNFV